MGEAVTRELWTVRAGTVPYRRAWAWQRALAARRAASRVWRIGTGEDPPTRR
jgi:hypothetical protein